MSARVGSQEITMADGKDVREAHFHLDTREELYIRCLEGNEEIGRLFEYRVELLRKHAKDPMTPDEFLGKSATVELKDHESSSRFFNGWVTHFERAGEIEGRFDVYLITVRPWLWHLTQGSDCRIFQHKSAVEIIQEVFNGYKTKELESRLKVTYRKRGFCVQYRESDFAFVSRLMEEEGIHYHFEHSKGHHVMVLGDSTDAHKPIRGDGLAWAPAQSDKAGADGRPSHDIITEWRRVHSVRTLEYTHTDYDFEAPTSDLKGTAKRKKQYNEPGTLEIYDYPGEYDDPEQSGKTGVKQKEAERLAKLRIQAYESHHAMATATTPCRGVVAGASIDFKDHLDEHKYLIARNLFTFRSGEFESKQADDRWGFESQIELVSSEVHYIPFAVTHKPVIAGPQTAVVVGPSGDEIHTDKHGRVKVQFMWDRVGKKDANSSCWVRVSQPWAGKKFGFVNLPRLGDEVIVEFLEGNPDRPIVTGRVYNGNNMPPYELPKHATITGLKTHSTPASKEAEFNELRFEDRNGNEYVWLKAAKDYHLLVNNDASETVENSRWTSIKKDFAHKVGENITLDVGKVATVAIQGDTHAKFGADLNVAIAGGLNVKTDGAITVKGSKLALTTDQGVDLSVGAALQVTANNTVHISGTAGVVIDGGMQLCIKAGGAFITLGPDGVTIQGTMVKVNSGGAAGTAKAAASANPAQPKAPKLPEKDKDPLTSS
jgi:type VI secretion system secreted protein VgrG